MQTNEIAQLIPWSEPNQLGVRTGHPSGHFWNAWRTRKYEMQSAGVRVFKKEDAWYCDWATSEIGTISSVPEKRKEVAWSDEQKAIFDWFENGTSNLVIRARAGTGKTATAKAGFERVKDERMLYTVFNKKNQREASAKITDPRVEVKTLHSVGYSCILRCWPGTKPDDSVELDRLKDICGEVHPEVETAILKLVGFGKNMLLEATEAELREIVIDRLIEIDNEIQAQEWNPDKLAQAALGIMELSKCQDAQKRISFNDMVWLPVVLNVVRPAFDLVLVDECQDMSLPQLTMAMRSSRGRVCAVGDDRQMIYSFRGCVEDGLTMMRDGLSAKELSLTTTYRCPKQVVSIASQYVPDYNAHPDAPDGVIEHLREGMVYSEAKPGDAILSRSNAPLMPICLGLIKAGIAARIEGRDIGAMLIATVRKMKARSIPEFFDRLSKWTSKLRKRISKRKHDDELMKQVHDQEQTLAALAEGLNSIGEIEDRIKTLFCDSDENSKPAVILSTVHKAKGLEWDKVFILRGTFLRRHTREEQNIYYVALTRAKKHLVFLGDGKNGTISSDSEA
jgi:DNA helicase-2/ATP-dependent DNA helicase PcrA